MAAKSAQRSKSYRRVWISFAAGLFFFLISGIEKHAGTSNAEIPPALLASVLPYETCTGPTVAESQTESGSTLGGDLPPLRYVFDPYPTYNGIALDSKNNRVVMSDENRKSILMYDRAAASNSGDVDSPMRQIIGPHTEIGYISGVEVDPARQELYAVNNDIEDRIVVFNYGANGDLKPKRHLYVPHQTWGVSLNPSQDEIAISVQQLSMVAIYRREAAGLEAPLRIIKGPDTAMADPHGIHWDMVHHEITVANHGNYSAITPYSAYDATGANTAMSVGGHFLLPSLTVYADSTQGDAKPLRTIQGVHSKLNWPMGIDIDTSHNEIAVANNGGNSVLVFSRTASGDAAPVRIIRGGKTGIASPMGVAIDTKNDELWVANYGDHTALVFSRTATGDIAPQRIVRNAPEHTPTGGFGNPYAVAYDSKRDQLLVPN